jgi:Uma2 family endonuclease
MTMGRILELVDGVLVEMSTESKINLQIAVFLIQYFARLGFGPKRIGLKEKIVVPSRFVTARDPDLILHSEASAESLKGRSHACLSLSDPNPLLVIEIASPGKESSRNYKRDYQEKSKEYAARSISEYWIIDPDRALILVGILADGEYAFEQYEGDRSILSPVLPNLSLSANQILRGG